MYRNRNESTSSTAQLIRSESSGSDSNGLKLQQIKGQISETHIKPLVDGTGLSRDSERTPIECENKNVVIPLSRYGSNRDRQPCHLRTLSETDNTATHTEECNTCQTEPICTTRLQSNLDHVVDQERRNSTTISIDDNAFECTEQSQSSLNASGRGTEQETIAHAHPVKQECECNSSNDLSAALNDNKSETYSARTNTLSESQIDFFQNNDRNINAFQQESLDNTQLRQSYGSLKKLFLLLSGVSVLLIICLILVLPITVISFNVSNNGNSDDFQKHTFVTEDMLDDKISALLAGSPPSVQRDIEKGAIHLVGHLRGRNIVWTNEAASSSLLMTRESGKVKVTSSGNYFLYAKVTFNLTSSANANSVASFKIYQESGRGGTKILEKIERTLDNIMRQSEEEYTTHRVVHLLQGDHVYIHIDSHLSDIVSKKLGVHEFGMFEI